jgi:hypothetical protein
MNNHTVSYESLIDFAAGDLSEIETAATAEHVTQCPECSVTVDRYRMVSELRFSAVLADPPPATVARVEALFPRYYPAPQRRSWFNWNWASGPVFAAAAVLVICMLSIVLIAVRAAAPDNPLYSVKMAVEGLELRVSDVLHQFAEPQKPKPTPTPTPTATPGSADTDLQVKSTRLPARRKHHPAKSTRHPVKVTHPPVRQKRRPVKSTRLRVKSKHRPVRRKPRRVRRKRPPVKVARSRVRTNLH